MCFVYDYDKINEPKFKETSLTYCYLFMHDSSILTQIHSSSQKELQILIKDLNNKLILTTEDSLEYKNILKMRKLAIEKYNFLCLSNFNDTSTKMTSKNHFLTLQISQNSVLTKNILKFLKCLLTVNNISKTKGCFYFKTATYLLKNSTTYECLESLISWPTNEYIEFICCIIGDDYYSTVNIDSRYIFYVLKKFKNEDIFDKVYFIKMSFKNQEIVRDFKIHQNLKNPNKKYSWFNK